MTQRRTDLTDLGRLIISAMQDVCVLNKDAPTARTPFHSIQIPPMSLHDYAKRIFKYSQCTEECFPFALVLIMRYLMRQPENIKLSFYNSHRLFITSLMISAKLRDDEYYSNAYYSSIGGVSPLEMNALEIQFLKDIQWDLYVDPEEFYSIVTACEENLFAEKMEHEIRKFREQREKDKQAAQAQAANAPATPCVQPQRAAPSKEVAPEEKRKETPAEGESSGGLSSSDSRATNATLSAVSSGADVTMIMPGGPRNQQGNPSIDTTSSNNNNHAQQNNADSSECNSTEDQTPKSSRTPTKAYFDPMNYSTVPSTGGASSTGSMVGRKRRRKQ